jgi:Fic family protein
VRFHHPLVFVHPFPNGNGRWSRLAADLMAVQQGGPCFTWGSTSLQAPDDVRRAYIDALHAADDHDLSPLVAFARSQPTDITSPDRIVKPDDVEPTGEVKSAKLYL